MGNYSVNGRFHKPGDPDATGINLSGHDGTGTGTLSNANPSALVGGGVLSAHFGMKSEDVSPDGSILTVETATFNMPATGKTGCSATFTITKDGPHGSGGVVVRGSDGSTIFEADVTPFENVNDGVSF